jgi:chromate reductase, NAD(P)H dehydrogenase (quinone)
MSYRVGVIVGSLRKDSFNRQLARAVQKLAPPELSFHDIRIDDLPLYNQDDDNDPHPNVKRLKSEVTASQALLFATPEYNRSIPQVCSRMRSTMPRARGARACGVRGLRESSASRSGRLALPWRNSICATCSPVWMFR